MPIVGFKMCAPWYQLFDFTKKIYWVWSICYVQYILLNVIDIYFQRPFYIEGSFLGMPLLCVHQWMWFAALVHDVYFGSRNSGWLDRIIYGRTYARYSCIACQGVAFDIQVQKVGAVRCRYNAGNLRQNPHKRRPIARPWGRDRYVVSFMSSSFV